MNNKTILLVEDNLLDEMLTLRILHQASPNVTVDVVRDGQQALDYLFRQGLFNGGKNPVLPIMVLLDLNLPRLSGLEVLERLRADPRTMHLPIAILSASDDECERLKCYQMGANHFVHKPLDLQEFTQIYACLASPPTLAEAER